MGAAARCAISTASVPPTAPRPAARDSLLQGAIPSFRLAHEADRHVGIAPGAAARSGFRLGAAVGALGVERAALDCVLPVTALGCRPLPASGNGEQAQLGKTGAKGRLGSAERTSRQPPPVRSYDHALCLAMEASMSSNTSFSPIVWKVPKYFIAVALVGGSSRRDAERRRAQRGRLRR